MVFGTLLKWNVFLGSAIGGLFIGMTFHAGIGVLESIQRGSADYVILRR